MKKLFNSTLLALALVFSSPSHASSPDIAVIDFYGNGADPILSRMIQPGELGLTLGRLTQMALSEAKRDNVISDFSMAGEDLRSITVNSTAYDTSISDKQEIKMWEVAQNWQKPKASLSGYQVKAGDHLIWYYEGNTGFDPNTGAATIFVPVSSKVNSKLKH